MNFAVTGPKSLVDLKPLDTNAERSATTRSRNMDGNFLKIQSVGRSEGREDGAKAGAAAARAAQGGTAEGCTQEGGTFQENGSAPT